MTAPFIRELTGFTVPDAANRPKLLDRRAQIKALPSLVSWLRADPAQVVIDEAHICSSMLDISGNGRHLAQATAANRPLFEETSGPKGLGAVRFDPSVTARRLDGTWYPASGDHTKVIICKPATVAPAGQVLISDASPASSSHRLELALDKVYLKNGSTNTQLLTPNLEPALAWHVIVGSQRATDEVARLAVDDLPLVTGPMADTGNATSLYVGAGDTLGSPFSGWIREIMVFSTDLLDASQAEARAAVTGYIADFYELDVPVL